MTWRTNHPGGEMTCDAPGCKRVRRNYCSPSERDEWVAFQGGDDVLDLCPEHRNGRESSPRWLTQQPRRALPGGRAMNITPKSWEYAGLALTGIQNYAITTVTSSINLEE